jgi:hypothetical protein
LNEPVLPRFRFNEYCTYSMHTHGSVFINEKSFSSISKIAHNRTMI